MARQGCFRLDPSIPPPLVQDTQVIVTGVNESRLINFQVFLESQLWTTFPSEFNSRFGLRESTGQGTFSCDSRSAKYNVWWKSRESFDLWLAEEQYRHCVELRKVQTNTGIGGKYLVRERYICARHGTGGCKPYVKKNPHWDRKVPSKRTGCPASLTIKSYPSVPYILGIYESGHNHPLGVENLKFTRIRSQGLRNAGYSEFLSTGTVPSLEYTEARGTATARIILNEKAVS